MFGVLDALSSALISKELESSQVFDRGVSPHRGRSWLVGPMSQTGSEPFDTNRINGNNKQPQQYHVLTSSVAEDAKVLKIE
jgi:hypothetical protein